MPRRYEKLPGRVAQLLEKRRRQGGTTAPAEAAEGSDQPLLERAVA